MKLAEDVLAAVDWHVASGLRRMRIYSPRPASFPRYLASHVRPWKLVQQKLELRSLCHHEVHLGSGAQRVTPRATPLSGKPGFRDVSGWLCPDSEFVWQRDGLAVSKIASLDRAWIGQADPVIAIARHSA